MRQLMYQYVPDTSDNWKIDMSEVEEIYFHNPFGIGDVFVARTFVKEICKQLKDKKIYYCHIWGTHLFEDIPNLEEISVIDFESKFKADSPFDRSCLINHYSSNPSQFSAMKTATLNKVKSLHINTWYNTMAEHYASYDGQACFPVLVHNFQSIFNVLKISEIENPSDFLPSVDYSYYDQDKRVAKSIQNIKGKFKKLVLVCNEVIEKTPIVDNFNINQTVQEHVTNNPDTAFIFTREDFPTANNVFFTDNILRGKPRPDLIYMGLIAEYCDVIIGRMSGPTTHTLTKANLVDNPKQYIVTTNFKYVSEWAVERDYSKLSHVTPFNMEDWKSLLSKYF